MIVAKLSDGCCDRVSVEGIDGSLLLGRIQDAVIEKTLNLSGMLS